MKGLVTAAVATPAALVLLLGAGMSAEPPAAPTSPTVEYPSSLPEAAAPFPGGAVGCTQPDPTGTGGCVTATTAWLVLQVEQRFGPLPASCWSQHSWNSNSDHPLGRGCDYTFGRIGAFPDANDRARGWVLAEWLRANADPLAVSYVIWHGQIWSSRRADEGWRPYTGGGVYDPTDPTGGHYDHIHVSVWR